MPDRTFVVWRRQTTKVRPGTDCLTGRRAGGSGDLDAAAVELDLVGRTGDQFARLEVVDMDDVHDLAVVFAQLRGLGFGDDPGASLIWPGRSSAFTAPVLTPSTRMRFRTGSAAIASSIACCTSPRWLVGSSVRYT